MKSFQLSLRLVFIITVSVTTFCLTVTLTYVTSKQYRKEAIAQLTHHITTVNQDFAFAVTNYIITENYSSLQELIFSYRDRPHLHAISVLTPDGAIIADSNPKHLGQIIETVHFQDAKASITEINFKTDTMLSLFPVNLEGTIIGWCQLMVNIEYLRENQEQLHKKVLLWGGGVWLLVIFIATIIATFIVRPVNTIVDITREVSLGNFNRKTDVQGPLEIRQLAAAFNTMIDELEARENLLRSSENRFRLLIEDINDWVWTFNENNVCTYSSPAIEHILGYQSNEMVGKTLYDFMNSDEAKRVEQIFIQCSLQVEFKDLICTYLHKDGKQVVLETAGRRILDRNGTFRGFRGVGRDITKKQQEAGKLKKLEQQLYQAQKMDALGTLAGGIAHDFNNILSAIIGYAEITEMELPENSQSAKDIKQIITAGNRAADLVQQILTFSRQTEHSPQPLRIDIILKEALKMLRASLPTSIEISTDIDQGCGFIQADPTNIHQIVINLCTNASHAIGKEKGHIVVTLKRVKVESEQLVDKAPIQPGLFVVLTVKDSGKGMNSKTMSRIFEPYFTSKGLGDGTGLGLAVVHGIVENCQGFIEVASEQGGGTTFRIYFPLAEEEGVNRQTVITEEHSPTGNEHIMVVDDEPDLVQIMQVFLQRLGYTVSTTVNSSKALEMFRATPYSYDLLITDQTMPELTGIELAQTLLEIRPDLPIILCTGDTSSFSEVDILAMGVRRLVKKPLGKKTLAKIVRQVLDETIPV